MLIKDISKFYGVPFIEVNKVTSQMIFEATPAAKAKHGIKAGVYNPTWQEVMERRFYMLPIHTSRTFLVTNSLASRLYLILLKLVARLYEDAFRLAEVCAIDTAFTPEEKWVFGLIQERAKQDQPRQIGAGAQSAPQLRQLETE